MSAINLLSPDIISIIRDMGWKALTPIQEVAVDRIMTTENNYILSAMTASGKTEAAFLPVLSKVDFSTSGVKVLYISPLKALINDQMERIEALCERLDVKVTKWHGDAKQSAKTRLINNPEGIVLMTPESLEAMFQHHPEYIEPLFGSLEFVIVDEIHYFLGTNRGTHLRSLLIRLRDYCGNPYRFIGLSATIGGDFSTAKEFLGFPEETKILIDKSPRPMELSVEYYPQADDGKNQLPEEMLISISKVIVGKKTLIFPNSRGRVEEIASKLKELTGGSMPILAHYSSLPKDEREAVEEMAKNSPDNLAICCTSTLELGIDIGDVDQIIQVGPPSGAASLAQRAGRSGRHTGIAKIILYASKPTDLLRSIAAYSLASRGEVEAPDATCWYNALPYQMLSIVKENKELTPEELLSRIKHNAALSFAPEDDVQDINDKLIQDENLECLDGKLIIGSEGEKNIGKMDSYTIFDAPNDYDIVCDKVIGKHPANQPVAVGKVFLLKGNSWEITGIDRDSKDIIRKIYVKPSSSVGKKLTYISDAPMASKELEDEMKRILLSGETMDALSGTPAEVIAKLQKEYGALQTLGSENVPYYINGANLFCFFPFSGTKIFNTLELLLHAGTDDYMMSVNCSKDEFLGRCKGIIENTPDIVAMLEESITNGRYEVREKYETLLPVHLQAKMESTLKYDIDGTLEFLKKLVDGSAAPVISYDSWNSSEQFQTEGSGETALSKQTVKLEGNVYLHCIFTSEGQFPDGMREKRMVQVSNVKAYTERLAASRGKSVKFVVGASGLEGDAIPCRTPKDYDNPMSEHTDIKDIVALTEQKTIEAIATLAQEKGCDKYAVLVFVDAEGRSYATSTNQVPFLGHAVIYYTDIEHSINAPSGVILHELLHLFGAKDLYEGQGNPNSNVAEPIRMEYPNEAMNGGQDDVEKLSISPFTEWRLGLTEEKEDWYDDFVA